MKDRRELGRNIAQERAIAEEIRKQMRAKAERMERLGSSSPSHSLTFKSGERDIRGRKKDYKLPRIQKIDLLSKAIHFSAEQYKLLNEIFDRFAQRLSVLLSNSVNHRIVLSLEGVRDVDFGTFLDSLPSPIVILIFDLQLTKGLLVLDPYFSFVVLNILLGGTGEPPWELREMTRIERKLFEAIIASKVVASYNEIWKMINPQVTASLEKTVMDPGGAMVYPYTEPVITVNFSIRLDELEAPATLVLPIAYLKDVLPKPKSPASKSVVSSLPPVSINPELAQKITSAAAGLLGGKPIEYSKVEIIVELGEAEVTFGDLLNLEVGDIITLETKQTDLIKVKISGKTKFLGRPGIVDNRYSVRIEKVLTEEEAELYDQPRW